MATILVADDSPTAAAVISKALAPLGHDVVVASDGVEAERCILSDHPDLVILDIIMPRMNGFELCRAIRSDPELESLPVIMVTAMDRDSDRFWGLKQGANEYLVKPVDPDRLTAAVCRYVTCPRGSS